MIKHFKTIQEQLDYIKANPAFIYPEPCGCGAGEGLHQVKVVFLLI